MGAEDEILGLIDAIYEAAFDSASWEAALTTRRHHGNGANRFAQIGP